MVEQNEASVPFDSASTIDSEEAGEGTKEVDRSVGVWRQEDGEKVGGPDELP